MMITYHRIGKTTAGYILVEFTPDSFEAFIALLAQQPPPSPPDPEPDREEDGRFLLDVPWLSQQGNAFRLDCGPACMAMALNWLTAETFTVDRAVREIGKGNEKTSVGDFIKLCRRYRVKFRNYGAYDSSSEALKTAVIRRELARERLVLALVAYDKIDPAAVYKGAHWLLLTGFDDEGVYFHDPYRNVNGGHIHMQDAAFEAALVVPKNQPYHGLAVWA
jgi:hypothetical protein